MIYNQTSKGANGLQNFLFPLSYLYVSQSENVGSHLGSYAIDFIGWGSQGRIYNCPYYAPFDCQLVAIWGATSPMVVWQSLNQVNYVDGTVDYATIGFVHDDNTPSYKIGTIKKQGDVIGYTGTLGIGTGDHVHMEVAKGKYAGYFENTNQVWLLRNQYHIYNACGVNDTVLVSGHTVYDWKIFGTDYPDVIRKRKKFPWVLYQQKLRSRYF